MLVQKYLNIGTRMFCRAPYRFSLRHFAAMYRPLSCLKNTSELAMSKIVLQLDKRCQVKPISTKPWEVKRTNNSYSTHSSLLEAVGEDMLEEEKEELANLTSRFLHSGTMAHQVERLTPEVSVLASSHFRCLSLCHM